MKGSLNPRWLQLGLLPANLNSNPFFLKSFLSRLLSANSNRFRFAWEFEFVVFYCIGEVLAISALKYQCQQKQTHQRSKYITVGRKRLWTNWFIFVFSQIVLGCDGWATMAQYLTHFDLFAFLTWKFNWKSIFDWSSGTELINPRIYARVLFMARSSKSECPTSRNFRRSTLHRTDILKWNYLLVPLSILPLQCFTTLSRFFPRL